MTNDEIRVDILNACSKFKRLGFRIADGLYRITDTGMVDGIVCGGCALTAVLYVHGNDHELGATTGAKAEHFARDRYGWRSLSVSAFVGAFDGDRSKGDFSAECDLEAYDLGRAVRAAVLP